MEWVSYNIIMLVAFHGVSQNTRHLRGTIAKGPSSWHFLSEDMLARSPIVQGTVSVVWYTILAVFPASRGKVVWYRLHSRLWSFLLYVTCDTKYYKPKVLYVGKGFFLYQSVSLYVSNCNRLDESCQLPFVLGFV